MFKKIMFKLLQLTQNRLCKKINSQFEILFYLSGIPGITIRPKREDK